MLRESEETITRISVARPRILFRLTEGRKNAILMKNMRLWTRTKRQVGRLTAAITLVSAVFLSAAPGVASAAPLKGYEAVQVSATSTLTMKPGETKLYTIALQNIGEKTWTRDSGAFVSVYTYGPKYRASVFQDASWYKADQPAKLTEASVAPKAVGHVSFKLTAPKAKGTYAETFQVAAEDVAWIPGSLFTVNITVADEAAIAPTPVAAPAPATTSAADGLSAMILLRSEKKVTTAGGVPISYRVGIKNTGTKAWNKREVRVPDVSIASTNSGFHSSWISSTLIASKADAPVAPGALDFIDFQFTAPSQAGSQVLRYAFVVDGAPIPNFTVDIPVEVTSNAPSALNAPPAFQGFPVLPDPNFVPFAGSPILQQVYRMSEPTIRVGILIVDDETANQVVITSAESPWRLFDGNGALLAEVKVGTQVTAFYKDGRYHFDRGQGLEKTSSFLRFVPDQANAVMTVANWDRRNRGSDRPYNRYRGVLELHYNSTKDRTWLINEIPMDFYLKGLGETSNLSPFEYQKTLITAARTYAEYHFERATKRAAEFFHITGYADDQVYRGYDQEAASPNIVAAVEATRGTVATYDGKTAITPYFSRSDGRTRDWGEVWGGSVAWIKSVPAPCDKRKGYTLWGHGVGMSATEALCMDREGGKKYDEILKYFYTGIALERYWQ
jgi:hypothetical protein